MKRNVTVLMLCALLLAADLIWARLTFDGRASLEGMKMAMSFAGQGLAALTVAGIALLVLRRAFGRSR